MTQHRREMRLMMAIIEGGDLEDEFMDLVIQGTGNTPFWLGQCVHLDTVVEDTEKLESSRIAWPCWSSGWPSLSATSASSRPSRVRSPSDQ